jgi:hypothetical protein
LACTSQLVVSKWDPAFLVFSKLFHGDPRKDPKWAPLVQIKTWTGACVISELLVHLSMTLKFKFLHSYGSLEA